MNVSAPNPTPKFLPAVLAGDTVESLYAMHGAERRWTYWLILTGIVGALACLPLVQVDVSVRAPGVVRAVTERVDLKTTVSGRIREVLVSDNEVVTSGQALVIFATGEVDEQMRRQTEVRAEVETLIADLQALLAGGESVRQIRTQAMRHELARFDAQLNAYRLAQAKAGSELARYTTLAERGIATRQELDNVRYEAERLHAETLLYREKARADWAARLKEEHARHEDLSSMLRRAEEERNRHVLRAPVGGVLLGFAGWSPGAQVVAGQSLGAISPEGRLMVESKVSTRDIGLIRKGQRVRLQVDAYPYTHWGMLDGVVDSIGGDMLAPTTAMPGYFKVAIRPERPWLSLPDGTHGELRKGLTLTARYVVARRSLLQLLYEDASAWLNPQHGSDPISLDGHR